MRMSFWSTAPVLILLHLHLQSFFIWDAWKKILHSFLSYIEFEWRIQYLIFMWANFYRFRPWLFVHHFLYYYFTLNKCSKNVQFNSRYAIRCMKSHFLICNAFWLFLFLLKFNEPDLSLNFSLFLWPNWSHASDVSSFFTCLCFVFLWRPNSLFEMKLQSNHNLNTIKSIFAYFIWNMAPFIFFIANLIRIQHDRFYLFTFPLISFLINCTTRILTNSYFIRA